ncbi:MAG: DUF1134 domain-containing protein [Caulobacterales bacterium]|nr:DUF1134 domain-containing protein [Caulobacterales bacterium]
MKRICAAALILLVSACATSAGPTSAERSAAGAPGPGYTAQETAKAIEDWLGVSAETAGSIVERVFADLGRPNAYIYGEEAAGAVAVGLRYGQGTLVMKGGGSTDVYWQGPSVGFDLGGNAAKTFTLVYNLPNPDEIFHRFGGVEGTAYLVGGVGVNYQRYGEISLAPMRVGVGWRAGANIGYLAYSRERNILPF